MNFLSDHFLLFLPVALILWYATRGHEQLRVVLMIAASLVFYADRYWWFVPIILAYCLVDWMVGVALAERPRRAVLAAGIAFNLGVLSVWKYTPLMLTTLAELVGVPSEIVVRSVATSWILPLGVSFYSFSGIAYMVDVYRRQTTAERDLLRYTLFTEFFPHLVAGPILRASEFLTHLAKGRLPQRPDNLLEGAALVARGSFRKAVLGDGIAVAIDPISRMPATRRQQEYGHCPISISTLCRSTSTSRATPTLPADSVSGSAFAGPRISTVRTCPAPSRSSGAAGI